MADAGKNVQSTTNQMTNQPLATTVGPLGGSCRPLVSGDPARGHRLRGRIRNPTDSDGQPDGQTEGQLTDGQPLPRLRPPYLPEISVTPFAGFSAFGLLSADYADLWVSCDSKAKSLENKFFTTKDTKNTKAIAINGFFVFFVSFVVKKFPFFLPLLCAGLLNLH